MIFLVWIRICVLIFIDELSSYDPNCDCPPLTEDNFVHIQSEKLTKIENHSLFADTMINKSLPIRARGKLNSLF